MNGVVGQTNEGKTTHAYVGDGLSIQQFQKKMIEDFVGPGLIKPTRKEDLDSPSPSQQLINLFGLGSGGSCGSPDFQKAEQRK